MASSIRHKIPCPQCQTGIDVNIVLAIDLTIDLDLIEHFFQGDINAINCQACHFQRLLDIPLIVHNPVNNQSLFFIDDGFYGDNKLEDTHSLMKDVMRVCFPECDAEQLADVLITRSVQQLVEHLIEVRQSQSEVNPKMLPYFNSPAVHVTIDGAPILQTLSSPIKNREDFPQRIQLAYLALLTLVREVDHRTWAMIQLKLGDHLQQNPYGGRAQNIEQAINHYEKALTIFTPDTFPQEWAMVQNNAAVACRNRILGDKAANLDQSIEHYERALAVYTRQHFPKQWATTLNNLAIAYRCRINGKLSDNLEQSIQYYQAALEVYTQQTFPEQWAMVQNNLALSFSDRIRGDRTDNLEQAIYHFGLALEVYTQAQTPEHWATTQNNLATTYLIRIEGNQKNNIEQAIHHCQLALQVYDRHTYPQDWAMVQNNLGNAYRYAGNFEQAIAHYHLALEIRTLKHWPLDWAITQNNLAIAYRNNPAGNLSDNIENAIKHYQLLLEVRTQERYPLDWALTQNNLAYAYRHRLVGDHTENIAEAIKYFELALQVRTIEDLPALHQRTARNLGDVHFEEGHWAESVFSYQKAIEAEKILLATAYTEPGRRTEVGETSALYARISYALLKLNRFGEALELLEQGKTRLMAQALALTEIDISKLSSQQYERLVVLRTRRRELENEFSNLSEQMSSPRYQTLRKELQQSYMALLDLIEILRKESPDFMPVTLTAPEILTLIPPQGVLVAPVITSMGSAVFVIPGNTEVVSADHVLWIDDFGEPQLRKILQGSGERSTQDGWLEGYLNRHDNWPGWLDSIENNLAALRTALIEPLLERFATLGIETGVPLIFLPQSGLGVLPVHALLLESFPVSYAPSAYTLHVSQRRMEQSQRQGQNLLVVVNPTGDLAFASAEGDGIAALFDPEQVTRLDDSAATLDAVSNHLQPATCQLLHFSSHGFYDWNEAMQSGLVLIDGPLTLSRLISQADLNVLRLATLSACETGITDINQSPDEFLGLPAGLMQAGAAAVVSTLWAVNDLSTMLLMERFYRHYLRDELGLPEALRCAQLWLRDVTARELAARYPRGSTNYRRFSRDFKPEDRPFEHPYYWAAFTFNGV